MHVVYRSAGGAGNPFHFGSGGGGYDPSPCDRVPALLALTPCSLDNLDRRFFAWTHHIRIDRRNAALDYSRHDQPSLLLNAFANDDGRVLVGKRLQDGHQLLDHHRGHRGFGWSHEQGEYSQHYRH